jgi:Zn ribbon nucleic-acid-binding protein
MTGWAEYLESEMCDYQGYEFGAGTYPDSVCIDGLLHDADNCDGDGNIYEATEEIPCPICRAKDAIEWWTERNNFFVEDGQTEEAQLIESREAATMLVNDIRKNRGQPPVAA